MLIRWKIKHGVITSLKVTPESQDEIRILQLVKENRINLKQGLLLLHKEIESSDRIEVVQNTPSILKETHN